MLTTITNSTFNDYAGKSLVLDFSATWCGPCKKMAPIFDSLAESMATDSLVFSSIDVEEEPDLSEKFGIRNIPTILLISPEGEVVKRLVGVIAESDLKKEVEENL